MSFEFSISAAAKRAVSIVFAAAIILSFTSCSKGHVHEWSQWEPYIEPSCYISGQQRSLCSCGAARYREIPVEHVYEFEGYDFMKMQKRSLCTECGGELVEDMTFEEAGIPVIRVTGSLSDLHYQDEVRVNVTYTGDGASFECTADIAGGESSTSVPKPDYELTGFYDDDGKSVSVTFSDDFSGISSVKLSANFTDETMIRNIASAKLYGDIVKSRGTGDPLSKLSCGGASGGILSALCINGELKGVYSIDTTAEELSSVTEDGGRTAAVACVKTGDAASLNAPAESGFSDGTFKVVYSSSYYEGKEDEITSSFGAMVDFVMNTDGEEFRNGISNYVDVDRTIDTILFIGVSNAVHNKSEGLVWVTFDGVKWAPVPRGLESTWGKDTKRAEATSAGAVMPGAATNALFVKIDRLFPAETSARWIDLRFGPLSVDSLTALIDAYFSALPADVADSERFIWPDEPVMPPDAKQEILDLMNSNLVVFDNYYGLN